MTVYVAEIKGRGIAAFHADTGSEAERLVRDRALRDDLIVALTDRRNGDRAGREARRSMAARRRAPI